MVTPNMIALKCRGRYDEAPAGATLYPGMLLLDRIADVIPHNVAGGAGDVVVCQENALAAGTILTTIASSSVAPIRRAAKGDMLLMLLQAGQNVAAGAELMSAGDGTLIANPGNFLYNIVAASSNITSTNTETTFSNGTYSLPANFLKAGDIIKIRAKAVVSAQNSTNTHRVRLYVGSTTLADSTALALAAGEYAIIDMTIVVRTIGASGTFIADGFVQSNPGAAVATTPFTVASTTLDTTAAAAFTIKSLASATSSGNVIALQEFTMSLIRDGGLNTLVVAAEAIDNSGSTGTSYNNAAFIRTLVQ